MYLRLLYLVPVTNYITKFLNVRNHDVVSQKNSVTLQQQESTKCRLACLYLNN